MLSSKLKSWVESHLTRKKSAAGSNSSSKKSGGHQSSHHHHHSIGKESPADRIAHPAASLVNLVPAVPLCSSSGRSNAGLVIRLQNDFAASSVASPCHRPNNHPSWTQSPVMLAWNTKKTQQCVQPPPPISPPPSAIIQQVRGSNYLSFCCCCPITHVHNELGNIRLERRAFAVWIRLDLQEFCGRKRNRRKPDGQ